MNVAIFNWRDLENPRSGGAEIATDQLASRLIEKGHSVTWFTSRHPGSSATDVRHGYTVVRRGSELTCRFFGLLWLKRHAPTIDVVIDEVNTLPFLSRLVAPRRVVLWIPQLAREVWLAEAPPLVGHIGYFIEPLLLRIYRRSRVVTISQSSARSLREIGLRGGIEVAEIALQQPLGESSRTVPGRIGYVGRVTPSKRIDHILRAFALVKHEIPQAHLIIIGQGSEKEFVRLNRLARELGVFESVRFTHHLAVADRDDLVATFDVLAMASMREGWGLVVSEAARYGIPSVVYPVPGLIDSVRDGQTGIVTETSTPEALAKGLRAVLVNRELRTQLGRAASEYLREFDDRRFSDNFERVLREVAGGSA